MDKTNVYESFLSDFRKRLEENPRDVYLTTLPTKPQGHVKGYFSTLYDAVLIASEGKTDGSETEVFYFHDNRLWKLVAGSGK